MRVKWLAMWYRLTPVWLSLWLISSFANPSTAWQHNDGSYCDPCTIIEVVQASDHCCEEEISSHHKASQSVNEIGCRQCCEPTANHDAGYFIRHAFAPATLGTPFQISLPVQRETVVIFQTTTSKLVSLPRPPPRGRAPPSAFSVHQI